MLGELGGPGQAGLNYGVKMANARGYASSGGLHQKHALEIFGKSLEVKPLFPGCTRSIYGM